MFDPKIIKATRKECKICNKNCFCCPVMFTALIDYVNNLDKQINKVSQDNDEDTSLPWYKTAAAKAATSTSESMSDFPSLSNQIAQQQKKITTQKIIILHMRKGDKKILKMQWIWDL